MPLHPAWSRPLPSPSVQVDLLQFIIELVKRQEARCHSPSPTPDDGTMENGSSEVDAICNPNFNAAMETGHTPLHLAAALGHAEFVQVLVANASSMKIPLNAVDSLRLTSLHLAISCMPTNENTAWCSVVGCLLKGGAKADSHIPSPDNVRMFATPLAQACAGGHFDQVRQLLDFGAKDAKRDALNLSLQQKDSPVLVPLLSRLISSEGGHPSKYSILWQSSSFPGSIDPRWIADALIANWMTQQKSTQISAGVAFQLEMAVTKVDLSNCCLQLLPIQVFQFPNLQVLAADGNELTSLPLKPNAVAMATEEPWDPPLTQSGWCCLNLQRLTLKKNRLTHLPKCLFQLPNLLSLEVSHNQLTTLPDNVWIAPQLQRCFCEHNLIAFLPSNQSLFLNQAAIADLNSEVLQVRSSSSRFSSFVVVSTTYSLEASREKRLPISESQGYLDVELSQSWGSDVQGQKHKPPSARRSPPEALQDRLVELHPYVVFETGQQDTRSSEYLGIRILHLANNRLTCLPQDLPCLCPNLEDLDLSNNQLPFLNLPFGLPRTLTTLTLNGNSLTNLACCKVTPELHFCTMPHSVEHVSENEEGGRASADSYYCHTHSASKLLRLNSLKVRSCDLISLDLCCPREAGQVDHTHSRSGSQEASVGVRKEDKVASDGSELQLTSADSVCPTLQYLYLNGNHLTEVPESVLVLTHLISLHLSHNPGIIHLPRELGRLRELREVHVEGLSLIFPPMDLLGQGTVSHDIITYLQFLFQQ